MARRHSSTDEEYEYDRDYEEMEENLSHLKVQDLNRLPVARMQRQHVQGPLSAHPENIPYQEIPRTPKKKKKCQPGCPQQQQQGACGAQQGPYQGLPIPAYKERGEMGRPPRPDEMPRPQDVQQQYGTSSSPHSPRRSSSTSSDDGRYGISPRSQQLIEEYRSRPRQLRGPIMQPESSSAEDSGADDAFEPDED